MYRTFFLFLKCTIQGGTNVDVLLTAFLYLWLKFWEGIDKYWIIPVRKLFYFHHCYSSISTALSSIYRWTVSSENGIRSRFWAAWEPKLAYVQIACTALLTLPQWWTIFCFIYFKRN